MYHPGLCLTMSNRGPKLQTEAIRSSFVVVLLFAFGIFFFLTYISGGSSLG